MPCQACGVSKNVHHKVIGNHQSPKLFFLLSFPSRCKMKKNPLMKRIVTLFKRTHEKDNEQAYPPDLEAVYKVTSKTLGVGSFAVVKECVHRSTGESYALKIILKKAIEGLLFVTPCINAKL